jgi:hypothetical protein
MTHARPAPETVKVRCRRVALMSALFGAMFFITFFL